MKVVIVTGGGKMGYTSLMLQKMSDEGLIDLKVVNANELSVAGLGVDFTLVDELHRYSKMDLQPSEPSAKRKALLAQLERAKVRRDKNAIRDLTRQLEKVW